MCLLAVTDVKQSGQFSDGYPWVGFHDWAQ